MRKWLLCTVFLLLATTLVAKEAVLRVGYHSSQEVSLLEDVVLSSAKEVLALHQDLLSLAKERLEKDRDRAYLEKVHTNYKNDNWDDVERIEESYTIKDIEFVKVDDVEGAREHVIKVNDLDLLLDLSGSIDGSLLEYSLTLSTIHESTVLVDTLSLLHQANEEREKILIALADHFLTEYSFIKLKDRPSNLTLSVDGVRSEIDDDLIYLTPGLHTLSFSSINKVSQDVEVEIENKEIKPLSLVFTSLTFPSLELVSVPFDALINIQGMDGVVGHYCTDSQVLPFALHSQREGFADLNLQINTPLVASTLELRPKWMDNDDRMKDAKDEMYKALRNTILSFASYVLVSSLDTIYPDTFSSYSGPLKLTCGSISIISLLDFLYKSGKYYHSAEQTYY